MFRVAASQSPIQSCGLSTSLLFLSAGLPSGLSRECVPSGLSGGKRCASHSYWSPSFAISPHRRTSRAWSPSGLQPRLNPRCTASVMSIRSLHIAADPWGRCLARGDPIAQRTSSVATTAGYCANRTRRVHQASAGRLHATGVIGRVASNHAAKTHPANCSSKPLGLKQQPNC